MAWCWRTPAREMTRVRLRLRLTVGGRGRAGGRASTGSLAPVPPPPPLHPPVSCLELGSGAVGGDENHFKRRRRRRLVATAARSVPIAVVLLGGRGPALQQFQVGRRQGRGEGATGRTPVGRRIERDDGIAIANQRRWRGGGRAQGATQGGGAQQSPHIQGVAH